MAARVRDTEREKVELVFRLDSELSNKAWGGHKYWYDGVPVYAGEDFVGEHAEEVSYRTVVMCALFVPPLEAIEDEKGTYKLEKVYDSTGTVECPGHNDQEQGGLVVENQCSTDRTCWFCEAALGERHGEISLGEGWVEAVYKLEMQEEEE